MGGNATAINRETGEPLKMAQKFDLRKVPREYIKKNIIEVLQVLNKAYQKKFKKSLWDNFDVVTSGKAFNGSSESMFSSNISDEEFIEYKPIVGDVDITVPAEKLPNLFEVLKGFEQKNITPTTKYWGQVKKNIGDSFQINAVFEMDYKGEKIFPQIDFEAVEYKNGNPNEFSKFSHNSAWEDIQKGFKGVMHKYWLMGIVSGKHTKEDAIILTPASKEWPPEEMRIKTIHKVPSMASFSIEAGARLKLRPITNPKTKEHAQIEDPKTGKMKFVYKEIPTEDSNYITDLDKLFEFTFGKEPSKDEKNKINSLVGLIEMSKKYLSKNEIENAFNYVLEKMWGFGKQQLERNNPEGDKYIKMSLVNLLFENFPYLKKKQPEIEKMMKNFYSSYKSAEDFMQRKMAKFKKESKDFVKFYYLENPNG